jgi:hypothetical protein
MAAGPLLTPAIEDLRALPRNAHERVVAERILLDLQNALGQKSSPSREEQEFIVTMRRSWEDARNEGRTEKQANDVLTVLNARGIAVPPAVRKRILAEKDLQQLERWLKKAAIATSLEEVIDAPAGGRSSRAGRSATHKDTSGRRPLRASAQR